MKDICPPDGCSLQQGFGENATSFYADDGLMGHPGRDKACGYGTPVLSPVSGVVSGTYTVAQPASDGYVAVFIVVETALEIFEFSIGHLSEVSVRLGQVIKKGDMLGKEGNKGVVYAGNTLITLAMQKAGDKRGAHRHYQKRVVKKVKKRGTARYLTNSKGPYKTSDNQYLEWVLPGNGFNSCVDFSKSLFTKQLVQGMTDYQVVLLQRALKLPEASQTGFFGPATLEALSIFHDATGLGRAGVVGPKTRDLLNARYGQFEDPIPPTSNPVVEKAKKEVEAVANAPGISTEERRGLFSWLTSFINGFKN